MKPILFIDFDGTLCHDRFWRSLELELQLKVQEILFSGKKERVKDWMLGKYTSEEINQILADESGVDYDTLWSVFVSDCEKMNISADVLNKINSLRDTYVVVLTTDNMDCLDRFTIPALGLDTYFDRIVNSYSEKILKDDDGGKTFQKIAEEHQSSLTHSVLIDNSLDSCQMFDSLGGKSCLVTTEKPLIYWLETV